MAISNRALECVGLVALVVTGLSAEAQEIVPEFPPRSQVSWTMLTGLILIVLGLTALLAWLVSESIAAARLRRTVAEVERGVRTVMGRDTVSLTELPDELRRVKDDVEALLAESGDSGGATDGALAAGEQQPLNAAIALLSGTVERLRKAPAASPVHRLEAALRLSTELQATVTALRGVSQQSEPSRALANVLRSGQLNHVLTTAPLLAVYFAEDDSLTTLRAAYQAAAALLELVLADRQLAVIVIPPLSTVARSASRSIGFEDQRGLHRIPSVRDQVVRAARELTEGEQLIVDCLAPGWRDGSERQRPQIVGFSRADWV